MVCDDQIGWRKGVRKVIVFTTDQSFHIAMDGKLGGLVTPNDGICHLNSSGFYTYSTVQDYPSIGHINHLAKEKKVSVIWAVTQKQFGLYRELAELVEGSLVGVVTSDSSNIVELIQQQYQAITNSIIVKATTSGSSCNASISNMRCADSWEENLNPSKSEGECKEVKHGTPVDFEIEITLTKCKEDRVIVSPIGIGKIDQITIFMAPCTDNI